MYNKTFLEDCLNAEATLFDIDKYIEYWHTNDIELSLREFLGFTPYEYEQFGKNSNSIIRDILRCRIEGIDFENYQCYDDNQRLAARSYDQEAIDRLKKEKDTDNE